MQKYCKTAKMRFVTMEHGAYVLGQMQQNLASYLCSTYEYTVNHVTAGITDTRADLSTTLHP